MADENLILDTDSLRGRKSTEDGSEELKFQEYNDSHLLDDIKDDDEGQTIRFTNHPSDNEEEEDDTELLSGQKKQHSFWTFEYYQQFFDVDTSQVLWRLLGSFMPRPTSNYLQTQIRPSPDLYGPFWVCATLVFTIAIFGDLADFISHLGQENYHWHAHFKNVTTAATVIYLYAWLVPACFYAFLHWRGNHAGYTFLEIACLYGYSFTIYIPISMLWSINYDLLRWLFVGVALALSCTVLLMSLWPSVKEDGFKISIPAMIIVFLLHAALAVGFKLYFFGLSIPMELASTPASNTTMAITTPARVLTQPHHQTLHPPPITTTT